MKAISYSLLRAIAALALGLVLVMFPAQAGSYLVITIGLVFLIPSLVSILSHFSAKKEIRRFFPIVGIGGALFGLWLVIMPEFFADLLTLLLGFVLLMAGVWQIASLLSARRWTSVPGIFYLIPSLIMIAGLVALLNPMGVRATAFIVIGVASLVYAVSELVNWFVFTRKKPGNSLEGKASADFAEAEDAEVIE
ncbi:MAG: DUF308 domain-containing protein [Prevotellaceae bacterium]|jgi:uncharacterized membrane protein HdeD (DUF308 family)|nr:DUF308 domain-containing protein [Prevotellaceae bacterium]